MSRLDAATPVSANIVVLSELSECECKSTSYGHWDSDGHKQCWSSLGKSVSGNCVHKAQHIHTLMDWAQDK